MSLDIAMGGSTNTILHLLAAAQEGGVPFTMKDIDRLSRRVPQLCKVAPNTQKYHIEDVHRAGGVMAILGELERAGLLHDVRAHRARREPRARPSQQLGHHAHAATPVHEFFRAGPAGIPTQQAFSQSTRWPEPRRRSRGGLHPQRRARLLRARAAWRCCTATSRPTAAS